MFKEFFFFYFFLWRSFCSVDGTILAILVEDHPRNISVKLF